MKLLISFTFLIFLSCSIHKQYKYPMPYLNPTKACKIFSDSLKVAEISKILVYHRKHGMSSRHYYIFWKVEKLEVRLINENGIFKPNSWDMMGFYRNERIFEFYEKFKNQLNQDSIPPADLLHYPYVDINLIISDTSVKFHLPNGTNSSENTTVYQFSRLIESILFNIEQRSYWQEAERKMKYFPKNYNPTKKKWQNWKRDKIDIGEIWDDCYH